MKTCTKCGKSSDSSAFYRHKKSKDGFTERCKSCINEKIKAYRQTPRGYALKRQSDKRRQEKEHTKELNRKNSARFAKTEAGKEARRRYLAKHDPTRRYRAQNPDKYAAHKAVGIEVQLGRMVMQPCARCGSAKADAHHEDYSKPLDVVWLCRAHHKERHRFMDVPLSEFLGERLRG